MNSGGATPRVVLGVSGGIAAYKSAELLRRLTETRGSLSTRASRRPTMPRRTPRLTEFGFGQPSAACAGDRSVTDSEGPLYLFDLTGKVAVVTGGTRGIGLMIKDLDR